MRCGSTLLLHILLTHPCIIGCGERNAPYHSLDDLDRLAIFARLRQRAWLRRCRYVVDQINHDSFTPNEALLCHARVRLIFLTREPPETIASIVKLTKTYYEGWSVEKAADYYVQRLNTLARQAQAIRGDGHGVAFTYRDLIEKAPVTFGRLQSFLGLDAGFSEQYALQEFTGSRGDPSDKIRAGRILRSSATIPVEIEPKHLARAWDAYNSNREILGYL
jgi:hypothetical protein